MKSIRRNFRIALLLVFIGLVVTFAKSLWVAKQQQRFQQLHEALSHLQLEIERYAVQNEGGFPLDLKRFVEAHNIPLPSNPFGEGVIKILNPGDPWEAGGIVYVAKGLSVTGESSGSTVTLPDHYPWILPEKDSDPSAFFLRDADSYVLVAYGPSKHPDRKQAHESALNAPGRRSWHDFITAPGIEWEHVEFVLTSGEGEPHRVWEGLFF